MIADAADQLTGAHIAVLRSDPSLIAFVGGRIYNYVPRRTQYPYLTYHITDSDEWDTSTDNGEEHSVYVHVWDDKEGASRTNQIMRRIHEVLHNVTSYVLTDHNLVNSRRVGKRVEREGQLYHGTGLFRVITEEK